MHETPTAPRQRRGKARRAERHAVARRWSDQQGGVVSRAQLRAGGVSRHEVRDEVSAGRWRLRGRRTVQVDQTNQVGDWWSAVLEVGGAAVLDGATALLAAGLKGFRPRTIDISVPTGSRPYRPAGVTVHVPLCIGPTIVDPHTRLTRVVSARAAIRAAHWAASEREAATVLAMTLQQRLARADDLAAQWKTLRWGPRRAFLDVIISDLTRGAQSLNELDFAADCRESGLPTPTLQRVVQLPGRTAYLDAEFEAYGVAVEIDGAHHSDALQAIDDSMRQNDVMMQDRIVLRIPVLGYRLRRAAYLAQVRRALTQRGWRPPS